MLQNTSSTYYAVTMIILQYLKPARAACKRAAAVRSCMAGGYRCAIMRGAHRKGRASLLEFICRYRYAARLSQPQVLEHLYCCTSTCAGLRLAAVKPNRRHASVSTVARRTTDTSQ
jgi:hypothetical protein